MRHIRPGERKRSPVADPSDDPLTRKRDEWKVRTMTEGDSKAPSASIAASTCCKAGARGKHTQNVVTTPGSVRGEEKSRTGTNQPSRRTDEHARLCLHCPLPLVRRQVNPKAERGTTRWEGPFQLPFQHPQSATTPKEKEKGKMGGKLPSRCSN